ncbi:hypothetical protein MTR_6g060050 [Medicago truncatula]|uniref:RNase H type-1 domain-containing protein n=1 Tax=Medicago truncatula TaxID=3880 RepID=G7KMX4_MEDTR|nr:hypothetical protein MTR_6g060050 [Medicago truncatula]
MASSVEAYRSRMVVHNATVNSINSAASVMGKQQHASYFMAANSRYSTICGSLLIEWLSDMRFDNVDFALDSNIIADTSNSITLVQILLLLNLDLLFPLLEVSFSKFTNFKVEFNRRQTNEVANALARVATLLATTYSIIPHCIEHLIIN